MGFDPDYLDVDVFAGLNFLQSFSMTMGDLTGILRFENGTVQTFNIGDSLKIDGATSKDTTGTGDHDGLVEFSFSVLPTATLHNETDLGFNIGAHLAVFTVDVEINLGIPDELGGDATFTIGPLLDVSVSAPVASINVFDGTFGLTNIVQQDPLSFFA